jgi:hypothetical protein
LRKWRAANPEKAEESRRKWRAANREKERETPRKWYAANAERVREERSRARAAAMPKETRLDPGDKRSASGVRGKRRMGAFITTGGLLSHMVNGKEGGVAVRSSRRYISIKV